MYLTIHSAAIVMFAPAWMKQYRINLAASSNSYTLGLLCMRARARARSRSRKKEQKKKEERTEQKRKGERNRPGITRVSERLSKHESEESIPTFGAGFYPVRSAFRGTQLCTLSWSSFTSAGESFPRQVPPSREN